MVRVSISVAYSHRFYADSSSTSFGSPITLAAAINLHQPKLEGLGGVHARMLCAKSFDSLGLNRRDANVIIQIREMGL